MLPGRLWLDYAFEHATFQAGDIREVVLENDSDVLVGRNILIYIGDPAEASCKLSDTRGGCSVPQL